VKRNLSLAVLLLCLAVTSVWGWNYSALQGPLAQVLSDDSRNDGIEVRAHFGSYLQSGILFFDLTSVGTGKAPADVFRVLLQFAAAVKEREFKRVVLAHRGVPKFQLEGAYFHQLGEEYSVQNPVFTMRTFPEHLLRPDGTRAFEQWSGGWLGVLNEQLEDFGEFHKQWYMNDMAASSAS
jgi:hypothetical protein